MKLPTKPRQTIPLGTAEYVAKTIIDHLAPHCHRLQVVGSIRRRRGTVGDIELLAIPRTYPTGQGSLFSTEPQPVASHLWRRLDQLVADGEHSAVGHYERPPPLVINCRRCQGTGGPVQSADGTLNPCEACLASGLAERAQPWGELYRKVLYRTFPVDIFTTTEANWGPMKLIRTGPAGFSQRWVSELKGYGLRQQGGGVHRGDEPVECITERQAFELVHWVYREPQDRPDGDGNAARR